MHLPFNLQLFRIQAVDNTVCQTNDRHVDILCLYHTGNGEEYLGSGHNDVGTVCLQVKPLYALFGSERAQRVV